MLGMRRFRVGVHVELIECETGVVHTHKAIKRTLDFDDSRIDAFRRYGQIEKEILKIVAEKEN